MEQTGQQTACFITQRRAGASIAPAPESVIQGIAENLGRPSDFQREGAFCDQPSQLPLPDLEPETLA
jgi:hypothetical protein